MKKIFNSKFVRGIFTSAGAALGIWIGGQLAELIENGIKSALKSNHGRHVANRKTQDDED